MKLLLLIGVLLTSKIAYCCTCAPLGDIDEKQLAQYDLIVSGKVVRLSHKGFRQTIYLKVDSYFKGKRKSSIVKIEASNGDSDCGIFPSVGEPWVMYAYKNGGTYNTNSCTRSKCLTPGTYNYGKEEIEKEMRFLNQKRKSTT